jgi:hypothetical protein
MHIKGPFLYPSLQILTPRYSRVHGRVRRCGRRAEEAREAGTHTSDGGFFVIDYIWFRFYSLACGVTSVQAGLVRASLEGLQKKMAAADYASKVPMRVQTENSEKVRECFLVLLASRKREM